MRRTAILLQNHSQTAEEIYNIITVTYQDLPEAKDLPHFLQDIINKFIKSPKYRQFIKEQRYFKGVNPFLENRETNITLDTGQKFTVKPAVNISSNFYRRIAEQTVNRLWYNPVQFSGKERFTDEDFDETAQKIAVDASKHGVGYGFWNVDKLVRFSPLELIPLHCETTNQLMAGVRFWRIDPKKPLHIQLYTIDGLQEFVQVDNAPLTQQGGLQPYRRNVYAGTATYSEAITSYNRLPIIPLHVNSNKISELTPPIEGKINAYDLLQTSKLDDFVTTKPIYWRIEGFSGEIGEMLKIKETLQVNLYKMKL